MSPVKYQLFRRGKVKNTSKWKVLGFIYIFMLVFALIFQGMPPVFGFIISSLGITHAQAGALMSFFGLPGIFISIPGGILSDIYGSRLVGIASLIIALVGSLLVGFGNNFTVLVIGRVISGIGALTIAIVAPQVLSKIFDKKDMGIAMGIFNTAMPLGTILTLNTFGFLAATTNWRIPLLLTSAYCFLILVLFFFKYSDVSEGSGERKHKKMDLKESFKMISKAGFPIWLIAIIWMMYNASTISYLAFGSDYYVSVGYDSSYSGFLTSLLMIGALVFSTFVGYLTDKFGNEEYFILGGSIGLAIALLLVPKGSINPLILGSLIGLSVAFVPSPVFSLVPKYLHRDQVGLGYGILSTCLNIGVLIGPFLVGLFYDRSKSYASGFVLMSILALLTGVFAIILKRVGKKS